MKGQTEVGMVNYDWLITRSPIWGTICCSPISKRFLIWSIKIDQENDRQYWDSPHLFSAALLGWRQHLSFLWLYSLSLSHFCSVSGSSLSLSLFLSLSLTPLLAAHTLSLSYSHGEVQCLFLTSYLSFRFSRYRCTDAALLVGPSMYQESTNQTRRLINS